MLRTPRNLKKRQRHLSRVFPSMTIIWVLILQVFIELILRREAFGATRDAAWEKSPLSMSLNVSLQLCLVIEESRTEITGEFTTRCNLRFYCDSMSAKMVVELRYCVEFLRTLTADILLDFVVGFHMIVEIGNLSEGTTAIRFYADKWAFARVESSVVVEVCDLCKSLSAVDAKNLNSACKFKSICVKLTKHKAYRSCESARDFEDLPAAKIPFDNNRKCISYPPNDFLCDSTMKSFG